MESPQAALQHQIRQQQPGLVCELGSGCAGLPPALPPHPPGCPDWCGGGVPEEEVGFLLTNLSHPGLFGHQKAEEDVSSPSSSRLEGQTDMVTCQMLPSCL